MQKIVFSLFTLILLTGSNAVAQQEFKIKGQLCDSSFKPVTYVTIILIQLKDSLKTVSDEHGFFYFSHVKNDFTIHVKALGFKVFKKDFAIGKIDSNLVFVPIMLKTDIIALKEIVIEEKIPAITLKKDTTEYNAAAYNVREADKVEDLLKKLPGVNVDQYGNVVSQGKTIYKLRVNGVDFFSGNVAEYIKQLPASIISKIQIIDDYGDEASFTGNRAGESTKMLNLIIKPGMNQGRFGDINLIAGTNERYGVVMSQNLWKDMKQLSIGTDLNTQKNVIGINNANDVRLTFNDNLSKRVYFSNNYTYTFFNSSDKNNLFMQSTNARGIIDDQIINTNNNAGNGHHFNSYITFKPDETQYIKADINISLIQNNSNTKNSSEETGAIEQDLITLNESHGNNLAADMSFFWAKKLNKRGRLLTIHSNFDKNNSNTDQKINDKIRYYSGTGISDSILNRQTVNNNKASIANVGFNFTEPINTRSEVNFDYGLNMTLGKNEFVTNLLLPDGLVRIDSLSQSFNSNIIAHEVVLNYHYNYDQLDFITGINLRKTSLRETYVANSSTTTQIVFFPTLSLNYSTSTYDNLDLKYSGNSTSPTYNQLQTVEDARNLQNVIIGNPNLKPSFTHALDLTYKHTNQKSNQFMIINLAGSIIQNQIITNNQLVKDTIGLKQITTYVNENGAYSLSSAYEWSVLFKLRDQLLKFSLHGNANYNYGVVYSDNVESHSINKIYSQTLQAADNLKNLSVSLSMQYLSNFSQFTDQNSLSSSVQNWIFKLNTNMTINKTFSFYIESLKQLNRGYSNVSTNNPFIVNAMLKMNLLKHSPINLQIQVLDLFNQANKINQVIIGNTITNSNTDYISRYLLVRLNIPFSKFGKAN